MKLFYILILASLSVPQWKFPGVATIIFQVPMVRRCVVSTGRAVLTNMEEGPQGSGGGRAGSCSSLYLSMEDNQSSRG